MTNSIFAKLGKEESPEVTVEKIKNILAELEVLTEENKTIHKSEFCHSSRITFAGTEIGANGKGITDIASQASAHAELLERLQNQFLFHIESDFDDSIFNDYGFYHSPDEQLVECDDLFEKLPEIMINVLGVDNETDFKGFIRALEGDIRVLSDDNILSVPFVDINKGKKHFFPLSVVRYFYGTNGMAAGNTREEAIVQSLSEILERYVNFRVLKEGLDIPSFSDDVINGLPVVRKMICEIETECDLKVICKDCSLDQGLPVVAVIFINNKNQKYFVKFGAHPNLTIALTRCLTENFQGRPFNDYSGYSEFDVNPIVDNVSSLSNINSIFANGVGVYPLEFLIGNRKKTNLDQAWIREFSNNDDMLNYYTHIIEKLGFDVFVRDVSFLDFPTVIVVVPGMSETQNCSSINLKNIRLKRNARKLLRGNEYKNDNDKIEQILSYLDIFAKKSDTIATHIGIPVGRNFPLSSVSIILFMAMLNCTLGKFKEAAAKMSHFVKFLDGKDINFTIINYYKCCRDLMWLLANGENLNSSFPTQEKMYGLELTLKVVSDLSDHEKILENIPTINCWNCRECYDKENCHYKLVYNIQRNLHKKMQVYYRD